MRRPPDRVRGRQRRARGTGSSRHLSLSATDAEWDVVRRNAQARGLSIARYLVGLVERGGAEEGAHVALSRDEQHELLRSVREIRALMLGRAVPEEADPARPMPPETRPEGTEPEDPGDTEAERLRREIRDWPGRAQASIADTPASDTPLAVLTERRQRMAALLDEAEAMRAAGSPHAPYLETMPEESAALAEAESRLAVMRTAVELSEMALLNRKAVQLADAAGGIAYDTSAYPALMERIRSLEGSPGLTEEAHAFIGHSIATDARWGRDRERVADLVEETRAFLRARDDLAHQILALFHPADGGPPRELWRVEGDALLERAEAIGEEIPEPELAAHLRAADAAPGELDELKAQLRARLGLDPGSSPGSSPGGSG